MESDPRIARVDVDGNVHYYYEVEPLGVFVIEVMTGTSIPLYYTRGDEIEKVR